MTVKRFIKFEGLDRTFEISKAFAINKDIPTLLSLDLLADGTVMLLYNAVQIPDFSKVAGITIIRED
jgi:hypothetical protein